MTELDQLCLWVAGHPSHGDELGCVPDSSCCLIELLAPHETREAYLTAYVTAQSDADPWRTEHAEKAMDRMVARFMELFMAAKGTLKAPTIQIGGMECKDLGRSDAGPVYEFITHDGPLHLCEIYRAEEAQRLLSLRQWLDVKGYIDHPYEILSRHVKRVTGNHFVITYRACVQEGPSEAPGRPKVSRPRMRRRK